MNLLQIVQRIYRESGKAGAGPTTFVGANKDVLRMIDWAADAWALTQAEPRDWKWRRATANGTTIANLSRMTAAELGIGSFSAWRKPDRHYTVRAADPSTVATSGYWPLKFIPYDDFVRLVEDVPGQPGPPAMWSVGPAEELMIGPVGDKPYLVRGDIKTAPTILADEADEPTMPAEFHMLLVWRALAECGKKDVDASVVNRAADNLADWMSNLIDSQGQEITMSWRPLA